MGIYFMLTSKEGDKWGSSGPKIVSDMTSVEWDTCIHIVGLSPFSGGMGREKYNS
jgi:hypothetical protein